LHDYFKKPHLWFQTSLRFVYGTPSGKIHVTLDFKTLLGIPVALPFCSAVVTAEGTIYVSGSVGAQRGQDGLPVIVPGASRILKT